MSARNLCFLVSMLSGFPLLASAADPQPPVEIITLPASSEPPPAAPTELEPILVTGEKRSDESLQSIPLSLSVIDQDLVNEWGLNTTREAMAFIPNVRVEDLGYFISPRIRGLSVRPENVAFEPPAGLAVDGIAYGRLDYFGSTLFDINRIEVLRGPQGTTFGKNTTAGLIHIFTNDPGDLTELTAHLQLGTFSRNRQDFVVSTPLFEDGLRLRVAGARLQRDGFVRNTSADVSPNADSRLQGRDDQGLRIKVQAPDLGGTVLKMSLEQDDIGSLGTGIETLSATNAVKNLFHQYDPAADTTPGNDVTSLDYHDYRRGRIRTVTGEWDLPVGTWNGVALSGYSLIDTQAALDVDFTPVPATTGNAIGKVPTTTVELRATSPQMDGLLGLGKLRETALGSSDILAGAFWQRVRIAKSVLQFTFPHTPFAQLAAATKIGNADPADGTSENATAPVDPTDGGSDSVSQIFTQTDDTFAVFGQLRWRTSPQWIVHAGLRASLENKEATWNQVFVTPPPNAFLTAAGLQEFNAQRSRRDRNIQPRVAISYAPTQEVTFHLHYANSFKSGGFNAFAYRGVSSQLAFDPEYTREVGLDAKLILFDRTIESNLSLYRMLLSDFQVLTKEPTPGTVGLGVSKVENAASASTTGLELDMRWSATTWLSIRASGSYNEARYGSFPVNSCPADAPSPPPGADPRCDSSGKLLPYAPRLSGILAFRVAPPLMIAGATSFISLAAEYTSKQYLDTTLDAREVQPAYFRYRCAIGLQGQSGWSISLGGENLTNVVSYSRMAQVNAGIFSGIQEPPRQLFADIKLTW